MIHFGSGVQPSEVCQPLHPFRILPHARPCSRNIAAQLDFPEEISLKNNDKQTTL